MCISGFKNRFLPNFVLITLRSVGLQIKLSLAFWKSLEVYFHVPKFQILTRYGFGFIGLRIQDVHRRSKPEEQNLWIFFEGFPAPIEVIIFLKIPRHVKFFSGIYNNHFLGFKPENLVCWNLSENRGPCFWLPCFDPVQLVRSRFLNWNFYRNYNGMSLSFSHWFEVKMLQNGFMEIFLKTPCRWPF